jgi:hypothetical protein
MKTMGLSIWTLACVGVMATACLSVCADSSPVNAGIDLGPGSNALVGNGKRTKELRPLGNFSKIEFSGVSSIKLERIPGGGAEIEIEADSNLLPFVSGEIEAGTLKIRPRRPMSCEKGVSVALRTGVPPESLSAAGGGTLSASGLDGKDFSLLLRGNWTATLKGTSKKFSLGAFGKVALEAFGFEAEEAKLEAKGSGELAVWAKRLSVDAAGQLAVKCRGNPEITSKSLLGASLKSGF